MTRSSARFPLDLSRVQEARSGYARGDRAAAGATLRPQRPLQAAALEQARHSPPEGLGLDSAVVRGHMVQRLRCEGLADERVLQALATVERHRFVDPGLAPRAYDDTSLPIGHAQTISKPSVVGWMLSLLFEGASARARGHLGQVLEIGSGCGYQAALLLQLARRVVSVERLKALHDKAASQLAHEAVDRLALVLGDGRLGHAAGAPYDSIVAAAAGAESMPQAWLDQLALGGRLVAPLRSGEGQRLVVVDREPEGLRVSTLDPVHFVPLKSGLA